MSKRSNRKRRERPRARKRGGGLPSWARRDIAGNLHFNEELFLKELGYEPTEANRATVRGYIRAWCEKRGIPYMEIK